MIEKSTWMRPGCRELPVGEKVAEELIWNGLIRAGRKTDIRKTECADISLVMPDGNSRYRETMC